MRRCGYWQVALGALLTVVAACGDDDLPQPASIAKVLSRDEQSAPAGARLPSPLAVVVRAKDSTPVPRAEVRWQVVEGMGAVLSDSVTITDGTGWAEVVLTLGAAAGTYGVRASLVAAPVRAVSFTASATRPPELSSVQPDRFTGGDTVTIRGLRLTSAVTIEIGGVPAKVHDVSITGQGLSAVVPRCLVPGAVTIRARLQGASSNTLTATYESSQAPLRLAAGQFVSMEPAALDGCATFPDAGPDGAQHLLVLQAATGVPGLSAPYALRGDSAGAPVGAAARAPEALPLALRFHDFLRNREAEIAQAPKPRELPEEAAPVLAGVNVGDRRDFRVCSSVTCSAPGDFKPITAVAKYVGTHAAIYQDLAAPAGGFTDADFEPLGTLFDQELYEVATRAFGAESDIDRNGLVLILMTPVVNQLTPKDQCEKSIVTGFFFAIDVDPAFSNDERSNRGEVFYSITPDPNGEVTCSHPVDRIRRLVPVTFIHELQHMISYNQHVLVRRGNTEQLWLNEGLSHLAEELGGHHFRTLGDQQRFTQFVIGDLFDAYQYLRDPGVHFLAFQEGTGSLAERGATWLFVRYLVDRFGEGLPRRLSETSKRGADNVVAATGEPFTRLVTEWSLANFVSDHPDVTPPAELRYRTWELRRVFQQLHEQIPDRFDRPFPLEPPEFAGGTFEASGTLRAGSGDYFLVPQGVTGRGFTIQLTDGSGGPVSSTVVPRLNVIRIR